MLIFYINNKISAHFLTTFSVRFDEGFSNLSNEISEAFPTRVKYMANLKKSLSMRSARKWSLPKKSALLNLVPKYLRYDC